MTQINHSQMLPIGSVLGGRYRIERYLASGGFGNTYEVTHTHLGQKMALKEFFMTGVNHRARDHVSVFVSNGVNTLDFTAQMDKFRREAQRLSQLHHPNIVHVTDLFDANGTSYYVMDLILGESLSARLKRGLLSENEARNVLTQLLNALDTVHNAGLTHLDIKPENIMVDRTGHVTLIDFGASKQMSQSQRTSMSMSGMAYTPGYAPYEQLAQLTDRLGPWTDFYAVGVTMYHLLTGKRPLEIEPTDYSESVFAFPPQVSAPMRQFIFRMMNPNRKHRPQTVNEVRALLAMPDSLVRPDIKYGEQQKEIEQETKKDNKEYLIIVNGQRQGPFTIETLRSQQITPETIVWTYGMSNWAPASQVSELQPLFSLQTVNHPQYQPISNTKGTSYQKTTPQQLDTDDIVEQEEEEEPSTFRKVIKPLSWAIYAIAILFCYLGLCNILPLPLVLIVVGIAIVLRVIIIVIDDDRSFFEL